MGELNLNVLSPTKTPNTLINWEPVSTAKLMKAYEGDAKTKENYKLNLPGNL